MITKKVLITLVSFFAVISLSPKAWAVDCPILDTGQNTCFDPLDIYKIY